MSRLTTSLASSAPSGSSGLTLTTGVGAWTWGSWVEFIASAATDINITELSEHSSPGAVSAQVDIQVGVGTAGNEVPIGYFHYHMRNTGADGNIFRIVQLPCALPTISAGSRVALRIRQRDALSQSGDYSFTYFSDLDSDNIHTGSPGALPDGADAVSVTPNATPWDWSDWVEVAVLADSGDVFGVAWDVASGPAQDDIEFEVGTGAAGSEVPKTRFRTSKLTNNTGRIHRVIRSAVCPLGDAGTRVAVRMRKADTDVTAFNVHLLAYGPSGVVPEETEAELEGSFGLDLWAEIDGPDGTLRADAPIDLTDPASYYTGYKPPHLLEVGRIVRALSDERGDYAPQYFDVVRSDTNRLYRGFLGDPATRLILNKRVVVRMIDRVSRKAQGLPRTVAIGIIRDYELS